jgi:hypothetical protein
MLHGFKQWSLCLGLLAGCGPSPGSHQATLQGEGARALSNLPLRRMAAAVPPRAGAPARAQDPSYHFVTFDYPGAVSTLILGINNRRDISGSYLGPDGLAHGWARIDGTLHAIDYPGALNTVVGGINEQREVTGTYLEGAPPFHLHGFRWQQGQFTAIPDVPGAGHPAGVLFEFGTGLGTAAVRTSDRHQIVGEYADASGPFSHGFIRTGDAVLAIDFPGAFQGALPFPQFPLPFGGGTSVFALNNRGTVGGAYLTATPPFFHGYLYDNGQYQPLDVPGPNGPFGTQVNAVNAQGVVAGPWFDGTTFHGFLWQAGTFTTVDYPGASYTEIDSINDSGDLVGAWRDVDLMIDHGYIATRTP